MSRRWFVAGLLMALLVALPAAPAQKKKGKKDQGQTNPEVQLPDNQVIDHDISEMLGAWQVGDTNMLHKYYADDVSVVSGAYEPPLVGWPAYLAAYQRQRSRLGSLRLDRRNTFIFVRGNVGWASYQWDFDALVDGRRTSARGQTTLVFERRDNRWLIVHNHTSEICEAPPAAPQPPPAKPGA
jgi:ketosteroid isomerase-like protein